MEQVTWTASEFEKHDKPVSWFIALWIIVAALVAVSVLTKSLFMGILVVVAGAVVNLFAVKEPREIEFSLNDKFLKIAGKSHSLESFTSFWIFEEENYNMLSLISKKSFHPYTKIIMPKEYSSEAKLLLRASIEEEEQEESLMDVLTDWLRF